MEREMTKAQIDSIVYLDATYPDGKLSVDPRDLSRDGSTLVEMTSAGRGLYDDEHAMWVLHANGQLVIL